MFNTTSNQITESFDREDRLIHSFFLNKFKNKIGTRKNYWLLHDVDHNPLRILLSFKCMSNFGRLIVSHHV